MRECTLDERQREINSRLNYQLETQVGHLTMLKVTTVGHPREKQLKIRNYNINTSRHPLQMNCLHQWLKIPSMQAHLGSLALHQILLAIRIAISNKHFSLIPA